MPGPPKEPLPQELPGFGFFETGDRSPAEVRVLLEDRLRGEGRDDLADVLLRCRSEMVMACVCCSKTLRVEKGCKKRWCPVCAPRVSASRLARAQRVASRFQWPLAVTLTTTNLSRAEDCVAKIKDVFGAFRRTAFWKATVQGGIYGVEVTHKGRGFHPHIHCLLDCRWLAVNTPEPTRAMSARQVSQLCKRAQNELAEVWGGYVQQSKASVYVQRAFGVALKETLKYSIKPAELLSCACKASEIIDLIDAGRTMARFGCAHSMSKEFVGCDAETEMLRQCDSCGAVNSKMPDEIISMSQSMPELASERFAVLDAAKTTADTLPVLKEGVLPSELRTMITAEPKIMFPDKVVRASERVKKAELIRATMRKPMGDAMHHKAPVTTPPAVDPGEWVRSWVRLKAAREKEGGSQ